MTQRRPKPAAQVPKQKKTGAAELSVALCKGVIVLRLHGPRGSVRSFARMRSADAVALADELLRRVEAARGDIPGEIPGGAVS
jgi:hypothetical protein